ncbi:unnamed protein product [Phytophthora fragariaefolia]|uniref:Unnamed protein product n=1 Tax=Phytophthora fragariaefolia TaxID=1490495 RepID=A0A9W6YNW8_9STRA|nr:unnamed protein product [Phytophthora fragariaefolia]
MPGTSLPTSSVEVMLLIIQIMVGFDCLRSLVLIAITPEDFEIETGDDNSPQKLFNLLAPPTYVLCVWLQLSTSFTFAVVLGPDSSVGSFISRYSPPRGTARLIVALIVISVASVVFETLMLLDRQYLACIAMVVAWCGLLPFYLVLNRRHPIPNTKLDVIIFTLGELFVRLHFTWLTGALLFAVLDVAQYLHGDFFSYVVYSHVMGGMLALALAAYMQGRDPVVALMTTWFLVGLANRRCTFNGTTQETFGKLQTAATVMKPVFLLVLIVDAVRRLRQFLDNVSQSLSTLRLIS